MHVIGTAGHVDHGKSSLVKALTGTDPDRLREEKERGLTIELGFALLRLPTGEEAGIVDVPGHERFIKTMLAGVGGIDLALLVVAADEGVMPQTREHVAILDLLGIEHAVVALTKSDLTEAAPVGASEDAIREALSGTTLALAPIVSCSATTGAGLDELVAAIARALEETPVRRDLQRPRLPIDRVFTMAGFGTVVTGTLIDGGLRTGIEVEIVPQRPGARVPRIRGLQSHGESVDVAEPGRRTAINLSGVDVDEISRGMVVATRGWLRATSAADVYLRAAASASRPVRHNTMVGFHSGTAEVQARVLLLDRDELGPGDAGWAQLRLQAPVAIVKGDAFILRDPNETIGGGRIVATDAPRHRRHDAPTIAALEGAFAGSPVERLASTLARLEPVTRGQLIATSGLDEKDARSALETLLASDDAVALGAEYVVTGASWQTLTGRMTEAVGAYHRRFPLRWGMPREELRARLGLSAAQFEAAVGAWTDREEAKEAGGAIAMPAHEPALDAAGRAQAERLVSELRASPYAPQVSPVGNGIIEYLIDAGEVVRTGSGVVFSSDAYEEMAARIANHLREHGTVSLGAVRDMFSTSRKYAQAVLEEMDSRHITRRQGEVRVLRKP